MPETKLRRIMKNSILCFLITFGLFSYKTSFSQCQPTVSASITPLIFSDTTSFNGILDGTFQHPAFSDMDGDGLLDLLVGTVNGVIYHYEQNSANSIGFSLVTGTFNSINFGNSSYLKPTFTDLDGDGLLDLIIGRKSGIYGYLAHYEQASTNSYNFDLVTDSFNSIQVGILASPTFTDIDGDGLLDLFVGDYGGKIVRREQSAVNSLTFNAVTTSFNSIDVGFYSSPTFTDLNGDGILDMIIGNGDGEIWYYKQTTNNGATFSKISQSFNGFDIGFTSTPVFTDLNHDGQLDLIMGSQDERMVQSTQQQGSFTDFSNVVSIPSANQTVHVWGSKCMTNNITVTAPSGFEVSKNAGSGFASSITLAHSSGIIKDTLIYVRLNPAIGGSFTGDLVISSVGANSTSFALSGTSICGSLSVTTINPTCDGSTATLSASCESGEVKWYDEAAENLQYTGSPFETPVLTENTVYQVRCEDLTCNGDFEKVAVRVKKAIISASINPLVFSETVSFNAIDVGENASPAATDLDGDGLLDLIIGELNGGLYHYEQTSLNGSLFNLVSNSFNNISVGSNSKPAFSDLDHNGLLDLVIGNADGLIHHYQQDSANSLTFSLVSDNFNGIDVGNNSAPVFEDIDHDGLLDLIIGEYNGNLNHYEQSSSSGTTFSLVNANFSSIDVGNYSSPVFTDMDGDGLLDLFIGEQTGNVHYYSQASPNSLSFNFQSASFNNLSASGNASPFCTDLTKDGLVDLLIGEDSGNMLNSTQLVGQTTAFLAETGSTSQLQSYFIWSSACLAGDYEITAPTGFEVSLDQNSGFDISISVSPINGIILKTPVYIRLNSVEINTYAGNMVNQSSGLNSINIPVSGTVRPLPPVIPNGQVFCSGAKLVDAAITGTAILWYSYPASNLLSAQYVMITNEQYAASQTINGIESSQSVFNPVINTTPVAPTIGISVNNLIPGQKTLLTASGCAGIITWNPSALHTNPLNLAVSENTNFTAICTENNCVSPVSANAAVLVNGNNCNSEINLQSTANDYSAGLVIIKASKTSGKISSSNKIMGATRSNYAAKSIELNPGFLADSGTIFLAEIGGCN